MSELANRYGNYQELTGLRYGIIEVTTECQCACPGCYMVRGCRLNKGQMSLEQAIFVLDRCAEYCGRELETMDILGGEPLLWPYLQPYIEELLRRGIKPWVFTNMIAITPKLAEWLIEREIYITGKLNVNPDDQAQLELQARLIGGDNELVEKMIAAIEVFRKVGYKNPLFRVQNLIRKENIDLVPDYYRWCLKKEIGVDLELMGSGEAIDEIYWQIAPKPKQLAKMINQIQLIRQDFGLDEAEVLMPHIFGSCPFFDRGLYFAVNGQIRACSNSSTILASLSDSEPVRKAYESDLISKRRKLQQDLVGEPCHSCPKWQKCRGGCRATVEGLGDPFAGYPLCPVPFLN